MKPKSDRESVKPSVDLSAPEHDDLFTFPTAFKEAGEKSESSELSEAGEKTSVIDWIALGDESDAGASSPFSEADSVMSSDSTKRSGAEFKIEELFASIDKEPLGVRNSVAHVSTVVSYASLKNAADQASPELPASPGVPGPVNKKMPAIPGAKSEKTAPANAFEGTNEIYVKSDKLEKLCGSAGAEKGEGFGLPMPPPIPGPKVGIPQPPSVAGKSLKAPAAFEGTNEIYIQSHVFDAIRDEAVNERPPSEVGQAVKKNLAFQRAVGDSSEGKNILGIVNSGVLPSIDEAHMPDFPNADDSMLAVVDMAESILPGINDLSSMSQLSASAGNIGLTPKNKQHEFVQKYLYRTSFDTFGAMDWDGKGCQAELDAAFTALGNTSNAEKPHVFYLRSDCFRGRERFVRAFFDRCSHELSRFVVYADICPPEEPHSDLLTSLFSSRIGIFKSDDASSKTQQLLSIAESLLKTEDRHWGQNILLARFGLESLISVPKGQKAMMRKIDNDCDVIELLTYCIEHDASKCPVVVVLSENEALTWSPWRDIIQKICQIHSHNILVLLTGSEPLDLDIDNVEVQALAPLSRMRMSRIIKKMLSYYELPQQVIDELTDKSGQTLTQMCRVIEIFKRQNPIKSYQRDSSLDAIVEQIRAYPDTLDELDAYQIDKMPEEARSFLGIAGLLGQGFWLQDVIQLMSLIPMHGDIPGSRSKRDEWCKQVVKSLVSAGELIRISSREKTDAYYENAEWRLHRKIMHLRQPEFARTILGCYARMLELRKADPLPVAMHYSAAGMMLHAAPHFLDLVKRYHRECHLQTALYITNKMLGHIGPQHGALYTSFIFQRISLNAGLGQYRAALVDADMANRVGYINGDESCCVRALLASGDIHRTLGAFNESRRYLIYAVKMSERLADDVLISDSYYLLAQMVFESGDKGSLVNALRYAEKSLDIRRRAGDLYAIAQTQALCAQIYLRRGEPQRAESAATEAYRGMLATGHWYDAPPAMIALATSLFRLGEAGSAELLERCRIIVSKTEHLEYGVLLLIARLQMTIGSLQRQAVRDDLKLFRDMLGKFHVMPWRLNYYLLVARYNFDRKNLKKTSGALRAFFKAMAKTENPFLMSLGYVLSATLNTEALKRREGNVSIEKTEKLYSSATSLFESIGAWHLVADTLRKQADLLDFVKRTQDARALRIRADNVDPYINNT